MSKSDKSDEPTAPPAPAPVIVPRVVTRAVEDWAARKSVPAWLFKAAIVGARWECGPQVEPCLVTEAVFDAAVAFAENPHASVNPPKG